jgi:pantothenate kinase-related protein Tda10
MSDRREAVARAQYEHYRTLHEDGESLIPTVLLFASLDEDHCNEAEFWRELADAALAAMTAAEPTDAEVRAALVAYEQSMRVDGAIDTRWPAMRAALMAARKVQL